ncbi:hypothetical protein GGR50DRAFT_548722 [Xylaria sp. CBS 124048]|nr:hypothetical protein GGR50DRAFT_548722 [Xylaria sp. CBS 124048]
MPNYGGNSEYCQYQRLVEAVDPAFDSAINVRLKRIDENYVPVQGPHDMLAEIASYSVPASRKDRCLTKGHLTKCKKDQQHPDCLCKCGHQSLEIQAHHQSITGCPHGNGRVGRPGQSKPVQLGNLLSSALFLLRPAITVTVGRGQADRLRHDWRSTISLSTPQRQSPGGHRHTNRNEKPSR